MNSVSSTHVNTYQISSSSEAAFITQSFPSARKNKWTNVKWCYNVVWILQPELVAVRCLITSTRKPNESILKTLVTVSVCFFLCWTLNEFIFILFCSGVNIDVTSPYYHVTVIAAFANSCVNPFVYTLQYKEFQDGLRRLASQISSWCWSRKQSRKRKMATTRVNHILNTEEGVRVNTETAPTISNCNTDDIVCCNKLVTRCALACTSQTAAMEFSQRLSSRDVHYVTLHHRHFKRHLHLKWPVVHQQLHVIYVI